MEEAVNVLLTASAVGLLTKLILSVQVFFTRGVSRLFSLLLICFALHNTAEVFAHYWLGLGNDVGLLYRSLYAVALINLALVFKYAVELSEVDLGRVTDLVVVLASLLAFIAVGTDSLISTQFASAPVEIVQKEWLYPFFQIFCLAILVAIPSILIIAYRRTKDPKKELRCAYMLFSLSPLALVCSMVVIVMALDFRLNAVALLPLASSAFLFILFSSETSPTLHDWRRYLPFSRERRTSKLINETYARYSRDEISYKEALKIIETEMVNDKFHKKGGNASATAESMGLPRSSLYSLFARLNITNKN